MPSDDVEVIERITRALDDRTLEVPAAEIVRVGRRRRRDRVALSAIAVALLATLAVTGARRGSGVTVAGFAVQDVDGTSAIVLLEPSSSMEPTIGVGQVVAIDIDAYAVDPPGRGDIIAFRLNHTSCGGPFLKRVIGIPGDSVEERDGVLYVNGAPLDEPRERGATSLGPWTVEPGHLFVVGDHLRNSADSRNGLGQIPIDDVIGRVDLSLDVSDANVSAPPTCIAPG